MCKLNGIISSYLVCDGASNIRRRGKNMKKIISVLLIMSLFICNSQNANAASGGWKKAYRNIISNWKVVDNYSVLGTDYLKDYFGKDYKFNRYFVYDVNKDNVPELFLYSTTMGLSAVFTYYNNKAAALGCDDFYKINTSQKVITVMGHWHGSGGSGTDEYSAYAVKKNKLKSVIYIDYLGEYIVSGDSKLSKGKNKKAAYTKAYNKYFKKGVLVSKIKKYKLSSSAGLAG